MLAVINHKLSVIDRYDSGQSLIETVVAIFVLTTGLSSGLALAIFSFSAASEVTDKIVATGLAREGIETIRRMRDTNWLVAKTAGKLAGCSDLGSAQSCYTTWLTERYDIRDQNPDPNPDTGGSVYRVLFYPNTSGNKLIPLLSSPTDDYRLYAQTGGGLSHTSSSNLTRFYRKIEIVYTDTGTDPDSPYSLTSPLVLVRSTVWWVGRRCPQLDYLNDPSDTTCRIITEEYLTNWRNY